MTLVACSCCGHVTDDGQASDLPPLPDTLLSRGGDPQLVGRELKHIIASRIDLHPRSQQKRIGPSEIGEPCTRRLAYKLLDLPPSNPRPGSWKPTVGTAVHAWLEQALRGHDETNTHDRFYLEERVTVGQVNGTDIDGSCDVYDRVTATVIDWKIVGAEALRRYRLNGPGEKYRIQTHLYGRGFANRDLPVDNVAIYFLPQNGELGDGHYWTEPYDPQIAVDALTRLETVAGVATSGGVHALPLLPTADSFCTYCPWFRQGSTDLAEGCPGDANRQQRPRTTSEPLGLEDLSGHAA